jgi:small subunit ribosomal protein S17
MSIFSKKPAAEKAEKKADAKSVAKAPVASKTVTAGEGKRFSGVVVSTKMKDTIVVKVDRFVKHSKYQRFFKISKKFKAHDAGNTKKEGDKVEIVECSPISKDKRFTVAA